MAAANTPNGPVPRDRPQPAERDVTLADSHDTHASEGIAA